MSRIIEFCAKAALGAILGFATLKIFLWAGYAVPWCKPNVANISVTLALACTAYVVMLLAGAAKSAEKDALERVKAELKAEILRTSTVALEEIRHLGSGITTANNRLAGAITLIEKVDGKQPLDAKTTNQVSERLALLSSVLNRIEAWQHSDDRSVYTSVNTVLGELREGLDRIFSDGVPLPANQAGTVVLTDEQFQQISGTLEEFAQLMREFTERLPQVERQAEVPALVGPSGESLSAPKAAKPAGYPFREDAPKPVPFFKSPESATEEPEGIGEALDGPFLSEGPFEGRTNLEKRVIDQGGDPTMIDALKGKAPAPEPAENRLLNLLHGTSRKVDRSKGEPKKGS